MSIESIMTHLDTSRSYFFLETEISLLLAAHISRAFSSVARAPDCRLETQGCGQPSGGPRFKSGSADQKANF